MAKLIDRKIEEYLDKTLGIRAKVSQWAKPNALPLAIQDPYDLLEIIILGKRFALLASKFPDESTPATVEKHLDWIESKNGQRGIFASERMQSFNRRNFIEKKIPFIVPGNQLYLPDLGIDLREHLKKSRQSKTKLGPAAQFVLLTYLLGRLDADSNTATSLAKETGYAKMTMSRAIQDLEDSGIIESVSEGKERRIVFKNPKREIWKHAKTKMKSPVKKRIYLERPLKQVGKVAGLEALSRQTMLVAPRRQVMAITDKEWKEAQSDPRIRIIPEASKDLAELELEIWSYNPAVLSERQEVDPFSLILSIEDEKDERVEQAIEQIEDSLPW